MQTHLQTGHLDQTAAEEVRGVSARTTILGDSHARAAVAIGDIVASAAGTRMAAIHHLAYAIGKCDAVQFTGLAVDAVAFAEVALRQAAPPLIAEPGIDLLQIHGAARACRIDGVHDADARILD